MICCPTWKARSWGESTVHSWAYLRYWDSCNLLLVNTKLSISSWGFHWSGSWHFKAKKVRMSYGTNSRGLPKKDQSPPSRCQKGPHVVRYQFQRSTQEGSVTVSLHSLLEQLSHRRSPYHPAPWHSSSKSSVRGRPEPRQSRSAGHACQYTSSRQSRVRCWSDSCARACIFAVGFHYNLSFLIGGSHDGSTYHTRGPLLDFEGVFWWGFSSHHDCSCKVKQVSELHVVFCERVCALEKQQRVGEY